jgi:rubrerythrin
MLGIFGKGKRRFESLSEREVLALAIGAEEEDGRIYRDMAEAVKGSYPYTAKVFADMAAEEDDHRKRLLEVFKKKFGSHIPLVRREDVSGFSRPSLPWGTDMNVEALWKMAEEVEGQNRRFYQLAAAQSQDVAVRKLLGDLAVAEAGHAETAKELQEEHLTKHAKKGEKAEAHKQFVLQIIQPGLAGLMDGSVSTLAPLFAAAFATQNTHETFVVGLAASVGAGISMGLTEALADDGKISGRGSPWVRGLACGIMTTVGGVGHALPYLLPDFWLATTLAIAVVVVELLAIAWIQWKYMQNSFWVSVLQIVVGGALVVAAGMLLGGA